MSTADAHEWYVTVPSDDAELVAEFVAELRRQGVRPGQRVRLSVTQYDSETDPGHNESHSPRRRHLSFAGSISAEADLSDRTDEYLRGFGQE